MLFFYFLAKFFTGEINRSEDGEKAFEELEDENKRKIFKVSNLSSVQQIKFIQHFTM